MISIQAEGSPGTDPGHEGLPDPLFGSGVAQQNAWCFHALGGMNVNTHGRGHWTEIFCLKGLWLKLLQCLATISSIHICKSAKVRVRNSMGCCTVAQILKFPGDEPIDLQSQDHGRLTSPDSLANDVQLHRCNTASQLHIFFAYAAKPRLKGLVLVLTTRKLCVGAAVLQKVWIARQDQSLTVYGMLLAL